MEEKVLKKKTFEFALRTIRLCRYLQTEKREYVISGQLARSGTAPGALYRESEYAESKADFVHKLAIALKELNESVYWLELLYAAEFIIQKEFESMNNDAVELIKLLTASIKTAKSSLKSTSLKTNP